jgi:REP element-mobilizing transposase RayT
MAMRQLTLPIRTWGGRRRGAGRKPHPGRRAVPHRRRVPHERHCPAHVTFRACTAIPSLRSGPLFTVTRRALGAANTDRFRILHFTVQADHLHLVIEADGPTLFARGVQGLAIRVAKAINRAIGRRGRVWTDRFHARLLRTPREVRNALVYVLHTCPEAPPGRPRPRSVLVRALVQRLANARARRYRALPRRTGPDVACPRRVAKARTHRRRRAPAARTTWHLHRPVRVRLDYGGSEGNCDLRNQLITFPLRGRRLRQWCLHQGTWSNPCECQNDTMQCLPG